MQYAAHLLSYRVMLLLSQDYAGMGLPFAQVGGVQPRKVANIEAL